MRQRDLSGKILTNFLNRSFFYLNLYLRSCHGSSPTFYLKKPKPIVYLAKHLKGSKSTPQKCRAVLQIFWYSKNGWNSFTLFTLHLLRYTNADMKIFLHVCVHIKTLPWKFRFLNSENSRVIYPWSL